MASTFIPSGNRRAGKQSGRGPLTIVACDACRNSKTKCDGVRPSCQRCTDRGEKCHYVAKPDLHPVQQLAEAIAELETRIKDHEEFFRLLATVSEADALQLLARLRSGNEMLSLVDAGRQMRNAGINSHDTSTPTLRRSASVNGIISNTTIETIHASEQLAAIVAGGRLPVLEPAVDLGTNAPNLDARNSLRNHMTDLSDHAMKKSPSP